MAVSLLVDTSVWLDLAKDYRQQPVLKALGELVRAKKIELVVPQVVLDEFDRNKARVMEDTRRSLQSHFRPVKDAIEQFGDGRKKAALLAALSELNHRIGIKGDT